MKPRTADELAAWSAIGVDIEKFDKMPCANHTPDPEAVARYKRDYPVEDKMNAYLFKVWHEVKEPQERIQDMRAPDGRLVYPEMAGLMKNSRDYNR